MKIGILTFWWSNDNYGQLMQCYALEKYLQNLGHEVFLINYYPDNDIPRKPIIKKLIEALNPRNFYKFIKIIIKRRRLEVERKKNDRQFELFRKEYIFHSTFSYSSINELQANPPQADMYIVGSDQVWNYYCQFKNTLHAYFLDFGSDKTKKISYAASWGRTDIPDNEIIEISPLLKCFDYVSVREKSGIELCRKCGCVSVEWVCDPTLLLSADEYRNLYTKSQIRRINKNYLLLYMLSNECNFDVQKAFSFANKKNLEVVYVTGNNSIDAHDKFYATIPEWLYLIDNADYVITNSFHCGAFSTIFHKQFGMVALEGGLTGMNARIESLFELCGTGDRYVTNDNFSVLDVEYDVKNINVSENFLKVLKGE